MAAVSPQMSYVAVEQAAASVGLIVMGAQHPRLSGAKSLAGGTLVLLGSGPGFWPVLTSAPEWLDDNPDPVDRWSERIVGAMARAMGADAYYPFGGPPYTPFIDWALKSGQAFVSPVGAMVHDIVGMMISYRGALHFADEFAIPTSDSGSPCLTCDAPCATACPADALSASHFYDVDACHTYLDMSARQPCMTGGCAARLACPLSAGAARDPAQSAHHMKAFHPA